MDYRYVYVNIILYLFGIKKKADALPPAIKQISPAKKPPQTPERAEKVDHALSTVPGTPMLTNLRRYVLG